jgi:hypothetical protein
MSYYRHDNPYIFYIFKKASENAKVHQFGHI